MNKFFTFCRWKVVIKIGLTSITDGVKEEMSNKIKNLNPPSSLILYWNKNTLFPIPKLKIYLHTFTFIYLCNVCNVIFSLFYLLFCNLKPTTLLSRPWRSELYWQWMRLSSCVFDYFCDQSFLIKLLIIIFVSSHLAVGVSGQLEASRQEQVGHELDRLRVLRKCPSFFLSLLGRFSFFKIVQPEMFIVLWRGRNKIKISES